MKSARPVLARGALRLQLLHLSEHQDVFDARDRGGHHVEGAGGRQALRDAPQPVAVQVLDEGVVGRQGAGPDLARARAGGPRRLQDLLPVGQRLGTPEERPQTALAFHLDHQGGEARPGRQAGEGGRDRRLAHPSLSRHDGHPCRRGKRCGIHVPPKGDDGARR